MERIRFIEHRAARILYADYSGIESSDELRATAREASAVIQAQPPKSVRVLVNLKGVPYTLENVSILRNAVDENKPFVRARAVFGLPPIASLSFAAVAQISGANTKSFPDAESAKNWLASEA